MGNFETLDDLLSAIYYEMVPPGYENDPMIRYRADLAMESAARGWHEAAMVIQADHSALERARSDGFNMAVAQSMADQQRISAESYNRGYQQGRRSSESEVSRAYSRGFQAGASSAKPAPATSPSRSDIVSEAIEHCRVIEESNPSMADGAKACKRMIKKMLRS